MSELSADWYCYCPKSGWWTTSIPIGGPDSELTDRSHHGRLHTFKRSSQSKRLREVGSQNKTFAPTSLNFYSVISITGLAGRAFASWQCVTGEMWLRDFLPKDIPNARVLVYGYQATLQKSKSAAGIQEYTATFISLLRTYLKDDPPVILLTLNEKLDRLMLARDVR